MKDLSCPKYWTRFGELGANIGRAWMPSPQEAADTVLSLMRERDALAKQLTDAEARIKATVDNVAVFCLSVANKADEIRHAASATRPPEDTER